MSKTIKQVAEELGVSKQRVYRWVQKNCINDVHQRNGVIHIDDALESRIKTEFLGSETHREAHHDVLQNHINDAVIDVLLKQSEMLKNELEIKNRQIEQLNSRLSEMSAALAAAHQMAQAAQALHAGTIQQLAAASAEPEPEPATVKVEPLEHRQPNVVRINLDEQPKPPKKGFLERILRR